VTVAVYMKDAALPTGNPPPTEERRYRGVSYVRPIDAAKEAVPVADLADRLAGPAGVRRAGKTPVTNCLLPNHEDRSPSFVVYPETNSWFCYGCLRSGDVVDLARLAWGYDERDSHVAAAMLLMEFGHEVPQRPPAWFRKQERQQDIRDTIDRERIEHIRVLVFRLIFAPWLKRLPECTREEATECAWDRSWSIALRLYEQRRTA
jgi:CHC2 zinc finger